MNRYILNTLGSISIGAICVVGWAAYEVGSTSAGLKAAIAENRPEIKTGIHSVFAETRDITIAMIDKGRPGKPETMGLLPAARIVIEQAGGTLQAAQAQVAQTSTLVAATTRNLDAVGASVKETADSLKGTANAATGALNAAQTTITAAQAPLGDLDTILKDKAVMGFMANMEKFSDQGAQLTEHGNHIAGNFDKVSTKLTDDFLSPKPWYRKIAPTIGQAWDITSAIARQIP